MGTNYYLFTGSKQLARKYFAEVSEYGYVDAEYEIVDEPRLGYEIHLNKCSCGWRPLFQCHKVFKSFAEQEAAKRLKCSDNYLRDSSDFYSHNDEDYPIDWAVGDFS